jgi:hypothetical protein
MVCLPGSDGPIRRRSSASSIARNIDWGAPIGGQTIVGYDDRDIPAFKRRAKEGPVIFTA